MDTLTDILTSVFVSKKSRTKNHKLLDTKVSSSKPVQEEPVQQESVQEEPVQEEPVQEEPVQEEPVQEEPVQEEPVQQESVQEEPVQQEPVQEEPVQEEPVQQESVQEEPVQQEPVQQESVQEEQIKLELEEDSFSQKGSGKFNYELNERNILVINKEISDNINVLSLLLHKLNPKEFENTLSVMCYSEDKTFYKKMLIENPDINFVNLHFVSKIKKSKLKQIVVVDFDYIDDINEVTEFFDDNIYLIVTSTNYSSYTGELMNVMRKYKSTLLLNKKDSLKLLQKRLFKKVISSNLDDSIDMNDYIEYIKNGEFIVIKSGELNYM
jgi:hypothetical protein